MIFFAKTVSFKISDAQSETLEIERLSIDARGLRGSVSQAGCKNGLFLSTLQSCASLFALNQPKPQFQMKWIFNLSSLIIQASFASKFHRKIRVYTFQNGVRKGTIFFVILHWKMRTFCWPLPAPPRPRFPTQSAEICLCERTPSATAWLGIKVGPGSDEVRGSLAKGEANVSDLQLLRIPSSLGLFTLKKKSDSSDAKAVEITRNAQLYHFE